MTLVRLWSARAKFMFCLGATLLGTGLLVMAGTSRVDAASRLGHTPTNHVSLIQQTAWVPAGGAFQLHLAVSSPEPASNLEIYVGVYHRLSNRSSFAQTLKDRLPTGLLTSWDPVRLDRLPTDPSGDAVFTIGVVGPGAASTSPAPTTPPPGQVSLDLASCLACGGVYPVRVELRSVGSGAELDRFTTHLIYTTPDVNSRKLNVSWVIPVKGTPGLGPDGHQSLAPGISGALAGLANALGTHPTVPVVLSPEPQTLQALATSARAVDHNTLGELVALADNTTTSQIVSRPYVPINTSGLVSSGLSAEAKAQISRGSSILTNTLHVKRSAATWVTAATMNSSGLAFLASQGVKQLVLPEADLTVLDQPLTLTKPFAINHQLGLEAFAADPGLAAHFASGSDPVLAAHQLLADLAEIYFDSPDAVMARGVVVQTPSDWLPQPQFLNVVLGGLAQSPIAAPVTLSTLFATVPRAPSVAGGPNASPSGAGARSGAAGLVRSLVANQAIPMPPAGAIRGARDQLSSLASALAPQAPMLSTINDVLLAGESSDLRPSDQSRYLDGVGQLIDGELAKISLPQPRSLTLTSRTGHIPITIQSTLGVPIKAVVRVASDKLGFPQGASQSVVLNGNSVTAIFDVRARGTGVFPLQVQLIAPEGALVLASTRLTVSSTVFSVVAVVITVVAIAFLIGWWSRTTLKARRRRRNPRLVPPGS